jgi:hypothetical protein
MQVDRRLALRLSANVITVNVTTFCVPVPSV